MRAALQVSTRLLIYLALSYAWASEAAAVPSSAQVLSVPCSESARAEFLKGQALYARKSQTKPQDYRDAVEFFRKADEMGCPEAAAYLGISYLYGHGVPRDVERARAISERAAAAGNELAEFTMGHIHKDGLGVPVDHATARSWYRRAAERGNAEAATIVGLTYEGGYGGPRDVSEAIRWYQRATAMGHAKAPTRLAGLLAGQADDKELLRLYQLSSERGDPDGIMMLAYMNEEGKGTARNVQRAVALYERAVGLGSAESARMLGLIYERGDGVAVDQVRAARYFRDAASGGSEKAKVRFAHYQFHGLGDIERDRSAAITTVERAAQAGDVDAQLWLARLHDDVLSGYGDYPTAVYWYAAAARNGQADASAWLMARAPTYKVMTALQHRVLIRSSRSASADVLGVVSKGRALYRLGEAVDAWQRVLDLDSQIVGWVPTSQLSLPQGGGLDDIVIPMRSGN